MGAGATAGASDSTRRSGSHRRPGGRYQFQSPSKLILAGPSQEDFCRSDIANAVRCGLAYTCIDSAREFEREVFGNSTLCSAGDAVRHAFLMCCIAQRTGSSDFAIELGEAHEVSVRSACDQHMQDFFNNEVGAMLGDTAADCGDAVLAALAAGDLQTECQ